VREEEKRKMVRKGYAKIAKEQRSCCGSQSSPCGDSNTYEEMSKKIGYTEEELRSVPEASNLGLGCGNPVALASLKEGETVVDLGSGGGLDCFLAAKRVGEKGKVIGVDMTPEMIDKARENVRKSDYKNVEFRLGEIENLPVADNTADIVISNCVINLSPNKKRVFEEAFRVLKPNGRLVVSDIVLLKELPEAIRKSDKAYISCVSGAIMKDKYLETIRQVGFQDVRIVGETFFSKEDVAVDPDAKEALSDAEIAERTERVLSSIESIKVSGTKPSH
jgi:ubiquinone/menaquinone biosynthesis C-methylase UbiE